MELKILSDKQNTLLKRKEVTFSITHESSTMSKAEILKEVSKKLSLNPESTIVINVNQHFGEKTSTGVAHSYESKQDLEKVEKKYLLKRSGIVVEEAAKPAAAPKKEEKAEEKKE
ncbi:MAG TPA: hypothetical protein VND15_02525 [Candidatus Acidoferrales bacterium]|nr:hypothetical protein [Candidatus Acidoferrales bacterium]